MSIAVRVAGSLCLLLFLADPGHAHPLPQRKVVLTERDDGRTIEVRREASVTVRLKAQLGTGYSWRALPYDSTRLAGPGEPTVEALDRTQAGGAEVQVFRFRALKRGLVPLGLVYAQPWAQGEAPRKRFRITLKIR